MPELPEVETVRRTLKDKLIGRKIVSCQIYWDNIIAYPTKDEFILNIQNQTIKDIERRGKIIVFILDNYVLLSHLRMEGKYFFKNRNENKTKHDHVIFNIDNNINLIYNDTRKFGKMYLIKKEDINIIGPLKKLGLEPFDDKLNESYLKEKYTKIKLPIKSALLDQSIITGIGNIYADEILFLSNINPSKKASELSIKELNKIIYFTKEVLNKAILLGGTTIHTYTSVDGVTGKFQNELLVHNKKDKHCPNCNSVIKKITINGRGTYYCEKCQK